MAAKESDTSASSFIFRMPGRDDERAAFKMVELERMLPRIAQEQG